MDSSELRAALAKRFSTDGYVQQADESLGLALIFRKDGERWGLALCPDKDDGLAYLGAFEAAMQLFVDVRRQDANLKIGLGLAFASTMQGNYPSYRRALKKYSNSIVFEDLGLSIFLVTGDEAIDVLGPQEINPFLRDLDKWIATNS